jgi:tRNA1Val (adenine37-N6)-methyltransferase
VRSEETLDELAAYGLKLIQPRKGYRFSLDPLLLCSFAGCDRVQTIADLGTGSGVIPLVMARKIPGVRIVGYELQPPMAALARRNVELNGLADRIEIITADVLEVSSTNQVSSCDLVLANPPYRRRGTGRISPRAGRDDARHESTATLADFMSAAKFLVKPSGRIAFVFLATRLAEFLSTAGQLKLTPLRLQLIHGTADAEAKMFLCELAKGRKGDMAVLPPLVVVGPDGSYTELAEQMINGKRGGMSAG